MPFCPNCGAELSEGANFCGKCGSKLAAAPAAPSPTPAMNAQSAPAAPSQTGLPAVPGFDFSRIPLRHLCPSGHVTDGNESLTACPNCGYVYPAGGIIQIYRMGNFAGAAVGMGIYIDDVPCGHLGNKQSIRISVPYGQHKVHMTHTTTRACNDPIFDISPYNPYVFCKAHFASAGFRIAVDPATPDSMPTV